MDEENAGTGRLTGFVSRALALVILGSVAQAIVAFFLAPEIAGGAEWVSKGPRLAVLTIVGISACVQVAAVYALMSWSGPDKVTRLLPWVARLAPLAAAAVVVPSVFEPGLLRSVGAPALTTTLCTTAGTGFLWAMLLNRMLHASVIRLPPEALGPVVRELQLSTLARTFASIMLETAGSVSLFVGGAAFVQMHTWGTDGLGLSPLAALACLIFFAGACAAAGASVGAAPGTDVSSIARRLDALGYNAQHTLARPLMISSFDDLGVLFRELERLRRRLAHELELYQDALERTRDAGANKAEFLAAVSHELRTPLNSICGFAQVLLEGGAEPLNEAQREDVRLIRAGGHQLLGLISDILDISMIESGELRLSFESHDLSSLIEEVVSIHKPLIRDRPVELKAEIAPDLPKATCDRRRIGQVITNLTSNAIKFTEEGSITLRARPESGAGIVLEVADTGVGIADDELGAIFEEYRQVGALKRRSKGTGLGLAIARSIATHHGGSLSVSSKIGEGSTFRLHIPLTPPPPPEPGSEIHRSESTLARLLGETEAPA